MIKLDSIKNMRLSLKILIYFLGSGLLIILILGMMSYKRSSASLNDRAVNQLVSVREIMKRQIESNFQQKENALKILSQTQNIQDLFYLLKTFHDIQLDETVASVSDFPVKNTDYEQIIAPYSTFMKSYGQANEFYDLILVCASHGHVIYSNST